MSLWLSDHWPTVFVIMKFGGIWNSTLLENLLNSSNLPKTLRIFRKLAQWGHYRLPPWCLSTQLSNKLQKTGSSRPSGLASTQVMFIMATNHWQSGSLFHQSPSDISSSQGARNCDFLYKASWFNKNNICTKLCLLTCTVGLYPVCNENRILVNTVRHYSIVQFPRNSWRSYRIFN